VCTIVDLQSVHTFCCYDNSAERKMSASACTSSMPGEKLLCIGMRNDGS